jgi:hypothetical protein
MNTSGSNKPGVPEIINIEITTIGGRQKKENQLIDGVFLM